MPTRIPGPDLGAAAEIALLVGDDTRSEDDFGIALDLDGGVVVVGAPGHDPGGTGFVFESEPRSTGEWLQVAKLVASGNVTSASFGGSVSIRGGTIAVGDPTRDIRSL